MSRLKVFSDKHPLLGPSIWILSVEYFIIQFLVAAAWHHPSYNWSLNTISDLGNTICGLAGGREVCSPYHSLMNASFICLGILMASGSLLIYQEFRERLTTLVGFSLMALAGFGTLLVGLFPENTVATLHSLGASLPFAIGNLCLIILSLSIPNLSRIVRIYTFLSGFLPIVALILFLSHSYAGLGIGGMERIVAYPQTIWLIFFGLYMSRNHYMKNKRPGH
jgi:hypothetical membrane protein